MARKPCSRYIYLKDVTNAPIMLYSSYKPSERNIPAHRTWPIREWDGKHWVMPCFPEITYGTIKKLKFIGKVK